MNRVTNHSQTSYHQQRFNSQLLPDLINAGPVSASILHAARDPLKFLEPGLKKKTDDMAWGSAVDLLWLTPELWSQHYLEIPSDAPRKPSVVQRNAKKPSAATVDAIAWWDSWEARALGKQLIDRDYYDKVKRARDMLDSHPIARQIWECSDKQVILMGDLPGNCQVEGVQAKAMLDLLPIDGAVTIGGNVVQLEDCIVDLKQCHNVSEYGMKNAIMKFEYHMKMAWYRRLVEAHEGRVRPHTILIFQNSSPPHNVHVRLVDPRDMEDGARIAQQRLDLLTTLNHADTRNLIDNEIKTISLADWMRNREDEE